MAIYLVINKIEMISINKLSSRTANLWQQGDQVCLLY
ncbi:hypothetical protein EDC55_10633 [Allofrancisella inopinata]|nr:hypothetical protein EDC55_10633 [Allofrancisella inopinata]